MDPGTWLVMLSIAMFLGAFVFGYIPLMCKFSEARLRAMSVFGAGLLVGTALAIIVPEGLFLWEAATVKRVSLMNALVEAEGSTGSMGIAGGAAGVLAGAAKGVAAALEAANSGAGSGKLRGLSSDHSAHGHGATGHEGHHHAQYEVEMYHWQVGASLVAGFAFMIVVDRISGSVGHSHGGGVEPEGAGTPESGAAVAVAEAADEARSKSAMLGLVIHAGVDGVAVGASALSAMESLQFIVFMAVMLHKAPAAFGLSTYLLNGGVSEQGVKQRLFIFSMAAPVMAGLTYIFFQGVLIAKEYLLGICMLFSGGTFLYVSAAHILPEIQVEHHHGHGKSGAKMRKMSWNEVWILVGGLVLPVILSANHSHGH